MHGRRGTPPAKVLSLPRVSFTGDGATDSAPCWWMIWLRDEGGEWMRGGVEVAL